MAYAISTIGALSPSDDMAVGVVMNEITALTDAQVAETYARLSRDRAKSSWMRDLAVAGVIGLVAGVVGGKLLGKKRR